jgi:hypothetical protein
VKPVTCNIIPRSTDFSRIIGSECRNNQVSKNVDPGEKKIVREYWLLNVFVRTKVVISGNNSHGNDK